MDCISITPGLEKFYNIVAEYVLDDKGTMYAFMHGYDSKKYCHDNWEINPVIWNRGELFQVKRLPKVQASGLPKYRKTQDRFVPAGCGDNNFKFQPQLTFPFKHLSYVEERLDKALKK